MNKVTSPSLLQRGWFLANGLTMMSLYAFVKQQSPTECGVRWRPGTTASWGVDFGLLIVWKMCGLVDVKISWITGGSGGGEFCQSFEEADVVNGGPCFRQYFCVAFLFLLNLLLVAFQAFHCFSNSPAFLPSLLFCACYAFPCFSLLTPAFLLFLLVFLFPAFLCLSLLPCASPAFLAFPAACALALHFLAFLLLFCTFLLLVLLCVAYCSLF